MIPAIGIAIYNRPDLLLKCVQSFRYPVRELIVVNNGSLPDLPELLGAALTANGTSLVLLNPGTNLGCAGGWNTIQAFAFRQAMAESVLICGNDIEWAPGDLALVDKTVAEFPEADFVFGNHSYSNFLIKRSGWQKVGAFDENIEIGYLEDGDHWQRIIRTPAKAIHAAGLRAWHAGSQTILSDAPFARKSSEQHGRNWEYYARKWNCPIGSTGQEKNATPFNAGGPVNDWSLTGDRLNRPYCWTNNPSER